MQISSLHIHPIKSCAPVSVDSVAVGPRGLAGDRVFMLVDGNGQFMSQRSHPKMALIIPEIQPEGLSISAPGRMVYHHETVDDGDKWLADLFGEELTVMDQGDGIAQWFSDFLEVRCRLVKAPHDFTRRLPTPIARGIPPANQRFYDLAPLLLISEASLDAFNAATGLNAAMARFRPNIVIEGVEASAELTWPGVAMGDITLATLWPCERCQLPNVNPETGEADAEIYRALRDYAGKIEGAFSSGVPFGALMAVRGGGILTVGDDIAPLA